MTLVRPAMLLFAVMLCMAGALAPGKALAHAGPHSPASADMRRDVQKQETLASTRDQGTTGQSERQCAGQLCCGPACNAGGCVIAADSKLPEPVEGSALIMPLAAMVTKGLGPTGIRRPPRA